MTNFFVTEPVVDGAGRPASRSELLAVSHPDAVIDLRSDSATVVSAERVAPRDAAFAHSLFSRAAKRSIDIVVAAVLGILLAPLLLLLAALVKLSDGGPVTFRQKRCGRGGAFEILKFRTMSVDAEALLASNADLAERYRSNDYKLDGADDPRVTRLGRFLRSSSLDELPQLWNVLRGEMSLVGPRPVVLDEIQCYAEHRAAYESVRPGMTGPWQVSGRNKIRYPERAELDADYARTWTVGGDLMILARTPLALLRTDRVAPTSSSPVRILHVSQPQTHGTANCVDALVRHQSASGIVAVVATPDGGFLRSLARDGIETRTWNATREFGRGCVGEALALRRIIKEVDPDYVHLHSTKASFLGRAVIGGRRRTITHPHAWSFYVLGPRAANVGRRIERVLSRWTDLVLCTGSVELRDGASAGVRTRMYNVGNGVDLDRFAPADPRERARLRAGLGLRPDQRVAVVVGRLCEQKGQVPFLDAWNRSEHRHPDDVLLLVGDGPDEEVLRSSAAGDVRVLGWRNDVAEILSAVDVYVQCSRWEGLALGLLEAMALDLPIVASAAGSTVDALGPLGVIVPVGDDDALVEATLAALHGDRPPRGAMRERASTRFCLQDWAAAVTSATLRMSKDRH